MIKRFAWVAGLALVGVAALPSTAQAAPPTRIVDHTTSVFCTGVADGIEVTVRAESSELAGTESAVNLSDPTTGEFIAFGSAGSDWTAGGVRAAIPVSDRDDQPAGDVYFSASFAPSGPATTTSSKFNDGNIHVVERHTEQALAVSDVVLTYGRTTFTDLRCDGAIVDGSLTFTNPAVHVAFSSGLMYECTAKNLQSWYIEGPLDELFVEFEYADTPGAEASGVIHVDPGSSWSGDFRLQISDEEAGPVAVTADLGRAGKPLHSTEGRTGMRNHARLTPYPFRMTIEGPGAPATLDCTLYDLRLTWRTPNTAG
jgi:hypothetical protein